MKGQTLKVALPGDMYERAGRWWWRVKLPGEDKAKARPLRLPGTKAAAGDRDTAEKVAVEMWEQAVRQTGARQITLDCAQKVERLKAQFLDKVRHLTEIVESANAKAQAEAQARAEIEARLNAIIQTAGQQTGVPPARTQDLASPQPPEQTTPVDVRPDATESIAHGSSQSMPPRSNIPAETTRGSGMVGVVECTVNTERPEASGDARFRKSETQGTVREVCPASTSAATRDPIPEPQTGICECCGAAGIPVSDLAPIDSGQLLCTDCLTALHIDISRIDAEASSDSHA